MHVHSILDLLFFHATKKIIFWSAFADWSIYSGHISSTGYFSGFATDKSGDNQCLNCEKLAGRLNFSTVRAWPKLWYKSYYILCLKNIPDIFDCNLKNQIPDFDNYWYKNSWQNLPSKWPFSFPPHPMYDSALPRENRPSIIRVKMNKKSQ